MLCELGQVQEDRSRTGEPQRHLRQALSEYRTVLNLRERERTAEALSVAREGLRRLGPRLGLVTVTVCCPGKAQVEDLFPSGRQTIDVCGQAQTVWVVSGSPPRLGQCR